MTESNKPAQNVEGVNRLFDQVMDDHRIKNDAHLAFFLHVAPPVISKHRKGILEVGPSMILKLHEHGRLSVAFIRRELETKEE